MKFFSNPCIIFLSYNILNTKIFLCGFYLNGKVAVTQHTFQKTQSTKQIQMADIHHYKSRDNATPRVYPNIHL